MNGLFIQQGDAVDFVPKQFVPAGEIVRLGSLIGITRNDVHPGELGTIAIRGVFSILKNPSSEIPLGAAVRWNTLTRCADISGDVCLGLAVCRATAGQSRVSVLLNHNCNDSGNDWIIL